MPPQTPQDTQMGADNLPMSEDELAAALGFITTLSESQLPQPDPMQALEDTPTESNPAPKAPDSAPVESTVDTEQDAEIKAIRAELEALKQDTYGESPENTEPAG